MEFLWKKNGSHQEASDNSNASQTDNKMPPKMLLRNVNKRCQKMLTMMKKIKGRVNKRKLKMKKRVKRDENFSASAYTDNMDVVLLEDLKGVFDKFGTVKVPLFLFGRALWHHFKYIDFKIGADSGYIRFEEPVAAQKACAAAVLSQKGGLVVKNCFVTLDPVTD